MKQKILIILCIASMLFQLSSCASGRSSDSSAQSAVEKSEYEDSIDTNPAESSLSASAEETESWGSVPEAAAQQSTPNEEGTAAEQQPSETEPAESSAGENTPDSIEEQPEETPAAEENNEQADAAEEYYEEAPAAEDEYTEVNEYEEQGDPKVIVLSYNVARYDNDTDLLISDEQIYALQQLLEYINADFVGIQEDAIYIDSDRSTEFAYDHIYSFMYAEKIGRYGPCMYSKFSFDTENTGLFKTSSGRSMRWGKVYIGDRTILFCNLHATAGSGNEEARLEEYTEAFDFVNSQDFDYLIMTGDFNSKTETDHINLQTLCAENGFNMANGGEFGWQVTHKNGVALDNIICSGNCVINDVTVYASDYDNLYSDHIPISASITLLDF